LLADCLLTNVPQRDQHLTNVPQQDQYRGSEEDSGESDQSDEEPCEEPANKKKRPRAATSTVNASDPRSGATSTRSHVKGMLGDDEEEEEEEEVEEIADT
jgi:hypothetical protein